MDAEKIKSNVFQSVGWQQEGHLARPVRKTLCQKPWFGKPMGHLANLGLPGKMVIETVCIVCVSVKWCVCVCVCLCECVFL